jgi:hypothetical protein
MYNLNPNNLVDQMRLLTGDFIQDEFYLEDNVYLWFYQKNGNSILDGSIEALESIINYLSLTPESWSIGDQRETKQSLAGLERRLKGLQSKQGGIKAPVIIRSDRKNWNDFDNLFPKH